MTEWIKAFLASVLSFLICLYTGKFFGFTGFSFAWLLNFILMAWYTYIDSLFCRIYNSIYFNAHTFEKEGVIYRYFGVNLYRKLLVLTGWEKLRIKENTIKNKRSSIEHAEARSKSSEAGHSVIFLIVGLVTILVTDTLRQALWLIILNLLLNLYPILVQRYNRPRYRKLLRKMSRDKV